MWRGMVRRAKKRTRGERPERSVRWVNRVPEGVAASSYSTTRVPSRSVSSQRRRFGGSASSSRMRSYVRAWLNPRAACASRGTRRRRSARPSAPACTRTGSSRSERVDVVDASRDRDRRLGHHKEVLSSTGPLSSAVVKPSRQVGSAGCQPSSAFAFAFDAPRSTLACADDLAGEEASQPCRDAARRLRADRLARRRAASRARGPARRRRRCRSRCRAPARRRSRSRRRARG